MIDFVCNNDPPDVSARFYFVTVLTYSISIIIFPYLNYITLIKNNETLCFHMTLTYLRRIDIVVDNNKVSSLTDTPNCGPFVFARGISQLALRAHSDIRKACAFVITTEPLGFVLIKRVAGYLWRV